MAGTKPYEPKKRSPAMSLDWATAVTEARRQRDVEVKAHLATQHQQRRQERAAWSEISRTRKV